MTINIKLCLSCGGTAIVSALIASTGDYWNALFAFAICSVLISGWKSNNQDLFCLSVAMFGLWALCGVIYSWIISQSISPHLGFIAFLAAHATIAVLAFNRQQSFIAVISTIMCITAVVGFLTAQLMPWLAIGNALFVIRSIGFIVISFKRDKAPQIEPKPVTGSVVQFEALHGRPFSQTR